MGGKHSRSKGRRGESIVKTLLTDRDWHICADLTAGISCADLLAYDPTGKQYSVECKNQKILDPTKWRRQSREQAKEHRMAWMLVYHVPGTSSWIVERANKRPVVWVEKTHEEAKEDA